MADQQADATVRAERRVAAPARAVFAAFADPERLARWWGPAGFTNTFDVFEFAPGGRWVFTMHGPNGGDYRNESVFQEIVPDSRVVIRHACEPLFTLTVTLAERGGETDVTWVQVFDRPEVAARLRPIAEPANEQNLDRLQVEIGRGPG